MSTPQFAQCVPALISAVPTELLGPLSAVRGVSGIDQRQAVQLGSDWLRA
jgi:hypothetical protein